jgi:hypothetical protein
MLSKSLDHSKKLLQCPTWAVDWFEHSWVMQLIHWPQSAIAANSILKLMLFRRNQGTGHLTRDGRSGWYLCTVWGQEHSHVRGRQHHQGWRRLRLLMSSM